MKKAVGRVGSAWPSQQSEGKLILFAKDAV
jgi:hypothetical protein